MIDRNLLRRAMHKVAAENGDFTLFALVMRSDSPGRWDLVVSAPWLDRGKLKAFSDFIEVLGTEIGDSMLAELARVAKVSTDDSGLQALVKEYPVADGEVRVLRPPFFDVPAEEAIIFRAEPSAARALESAEPGPEANTANPNVATAAPGKGEPEAL